MTLYSYVIPTDDGAAPNPFWGVCTLVICKPKIRSVAKKGDWIMATGSKNAPGKRDLSHHMVYAMEVTDVMPMKDYDSFCQKELENKLPDIKNADYRRRVGDCIYDFSGRLIRTRPGRHEPSLKAHDLSGKNALLSTNFIYFGASAIPLPEQFHPLIKKGNGHRGSSNKLFESSFNEWALSLSREIGEPQILPWGR